MRAQLLAFASVGIAGTLVLAQPGGLRVGAGTFRAPDGEWQHEASADGESLRLTRLHRWLGQTKGMTQIVVFRNRVEPHLGDDTATIAAAFFSEEERVMREQGVAAGEYELSDVSRGTRMVAGRTLYTLEYRKALSLKRYGRKRERAQLCLWFPDDFAQSRELYGFLISELREKGALVAEADLTQIDPVIASFRIERPAG